MGNTLILRFTDQDQQPADRGNKDVPPIKRIIGYVHVKNILPLFDTLDLDANPRSSKAGKVTNDILETLDNTPDMFHYKSKGILIGCAHYRELDRNRFELKFKDLTTEGTLDGGHNELGIGLCLLEPHMDSAEWARIKYWDDMKAAWRQHREDIEAYKAEFDFLIPVELLVPTSKDPEDVEEFMASLLDICAARNNNAQLGQEAQANKKGYYDALKACLDDAFRRRVEWKPNSWEDDDEKRPIKVRDLVAYSWLPLNVMNDAGALPKNISVTPQNIYRNKGECSSKFNELMEIDSVCITEGAKSTLVHEGVRSAFEIVRDLPQLLDDLYAQFPLAYNAHNNRFGANPIVKIYDPEKLRELRAAGKDAKGYTSTQPKTPMYREPVKYNYPEGLIAPLFYGLTGIMEVEDGKVVWAVDDPRSFVRRHLETIADGYRLVLSMGSFDPQKISKNPDSHALAVQQFKAALAAERLANTNAA